MGDSRQTNIEEDILHAQNVISGLKQFATETRRRNAISAVKKVVDNPNKRFKGGYVGQAPEYFTEKYLIEPVLKLLHLDPWPRPVDLVKDERNRPDYRIDGVCEDFMAIAESKALNGERNSKRATKDINNYLHDQTFLKTLQREQIRYSIGIATDGLEWCLIARDLEEDVLTEIDSCSIAEPVSMVLEKAHSEVDPDEEWIPEARRRMANSLISVFSKENIVDVVRAEFNT